MPKLGCIQIYGSLGLFMHGLLKPRGKTDHEISGPCTDSVDVGRRRWAVHRIYIYICIYVNMLLYIYIYVCVYINIYIYI